MTLADLKGKVAGYLGLSVAGDTAKYTLNSVDLLLEGINAAKRRAQRLHDFELAKCSADLSVAVATGGSLANAKLHGTNTAVTVKKVLDAFFPVNGSARPVRFVGRESQVKDSAERYSTLSVQESPAWTFTDPWVVQFGDTLQLYPQSQTVWGGATITLYLDVVQWLPDYSGSVTSDFFLTYGSEYLFWQAVCECNHLVKEFVYRQEGNLTPPEKQAENAWLDLLNWNAGLMSTGADSYDLE
jgi:hypothetical protein